MRLSIFLKLQLSFLLIVSIMVVISLLAPSYINEIVYSFMKGEQQYSTIITAATEASSYAKRAEGHMFMYLALHEKADKDKYFLRCDSLYQQLRVIETEVQHPSARIELMSMQMQASGLLPLGKELIRTHDREMATTGRFNFNAHADLIKQLFAITSEIRQRSVDLAKTEIALEAGVKQSSLKKADDLRVRVIWLGGLSSIVALLAGYSLSRSISRPLIQLKKMTDQIHHGNLDVRTDIKSSDEIGVLANSLNRMVEELQSSAEHVRASGEQLRESEERFRSLYENSTIGLYRTTPAGTIVLANPMFMRMLGYSSFEELARRTSGEEDFTPSDKRRQFIEHVEARGEVTNWESAWTRQDGSSVEIKESARAIRDPQGKTLFYDGTIEDITDRKRAEEALRLSEARLSNALKIARLGHWEYDVASDLFTFNDHFYAMFRTTAAHVGGYTMSSAQYAQHFVHPDDMTLVGIETRKALETSDPHYFRELEHRIIYADGEIGYIAVRIFLIKDDRGRTVKTYGVNQDVTERRHAEEALLGAQKLESIGTLAGGIAHDFNNLLVAVLGQSTLAIDKLPNESPAKRHIDKSIKAAERAANLTRQLLAYSGRGQFFMEEIDLNRLVSENTQILESSIPKTVQLLLELDSPPPRIRCDVGQIQQIIMNLIINAGEALGPNPGWISVRTGSIDLTQKDTEFWKYTGTTLAPGNYALLRVSDNGCGMIQETLNRIFDPFFTTKFTGRGLGLAAVLGIVRGHHGGIRIQSEEGKGTTFDVVFPQAERSTTIAVPEIASSPAATGTGKTVLVIDDEPSVLDLLAEVFANANYTVIRALNPMEGIELYREHRERVAAVILDYSMPGMDGKTAFEELVRIKSDVKVLLCSGYSEEEMMAAFENMHPAGFMHKPYKPEEILARVARMLSESMGSTDGEPLSPKASM